jgi:hypothetical protein
MSKHYDRWGKSWEDRNKEKRKAYRAAWYLANKARISEQQRKYRSSRDNTGESNG